VGAAQLVTLTSLTAVTRINVIDRQPAGAHQPGQLGWVRTVRMTS
jgi:hypothetical protein